MKKSDKVGEKAVDVPVNPAPNFGAPNLNPAPDFPAPLLDKEARKKANKKALKDAVKKAQLQFADDSSSSDEEDDRMDLEQVQAVAEQMRDVDSEKTFEEISALTKEIAEEEDHVAHLNKMLRDRMNYLASIRAKRSLLRRINFRHDQVQRQDTKAGTKVVRSAIERVGSALLKKNAPRFLGQCAHVHPNGTRCGDPATTKCPDGQCRCNGHSVNSFLSAFGNKKVFAMTSIELAPTDDPRVIEARLLVKAAGERAQQVTAFTRYFSSVADALDDLRSQVEVEQIVAEMKAEEADFVAKLKLQGWEASSVSLIPDDMTPEEIAEFEKLQQDEVDATNVKLYGPNWRELQAKEFARQQSITAKYDYNA